MSQLFRVLFLSAMVAACSVQDQPGVVAPNDGEAPAKPVSGKEQMPPARTESSKPYAPDQVLVKFRNGIDQAQIERLQRETGLQVLNAVSAPDLYLMKITDGSSVEDMLARLKEYPEIAYAEPNFTRTLKGN